MNQQLKSVPLEGIDFDATKFGTLLFNFTNIMLNCIEREKKYNDYFLHHVHSKNIINIMMQKTAKLAKM